jgi:hypothetical protein
MNTQNYDRLGMQMADIIMSRIIESKSQDNWTLTNMLPTKLELWTKKEFTNKTVFLGIIESRGTLKFDASKFTDKEELYVYYNSNNDLILFTEPFMLRAAWKDVKLGAVTYSSTSGHGGLQSGYSDMRGVWIHNRMIFPIDIYYKNNLVAQVFGYKGEEYMGGGASSIYFDNNRRGLNFMDQLSFRYSLPGPQGKYLFTVTIDDQQCNEMFVGVVSNDAVDSIYPDNAVYRIDKPSFTGIAFYNQIGDYESESTK